MKDVGTDVSDRELCSRTAEAPDISEMHTQWDCYHTRIDLTSNWGTRARPYKLESGKLSRSAAVIGQSLLSNRRRHSAYRSFSFFRFPDAEAKDRASHSVLLKTSGSEFVKLLSNGKYSDWILCRVSFLDATSDDPLRHWQGVGDTRQRYTFLNECGQTERTTRR